MSEQTAQATPQDVLDSRLMDSRVAKSELEWHASRRIEYLTTQLAAATARAEAAENQRDDFKRIGQQFQSDARKHFDQSCINLQRAEKAERERDALLTGDIESVRAEGSRMEIAIRDGHGVKILARMVGGHFRKAGCVNFAAIDLTDTSVPDDPLPLEIVVQRKGGKSPAQRIGELTAELATIRTLVVDHADPAACVGCGCMGVSTPELVAAKVRDLAANRAAVGKMAEELAAWRNAPSLDHIFASYWADLDEDTDGLIRWGLAVNGDAIASQAVKEAEK